MEINTTLNDIEQVESTLLTKKKFEDKNETKENPTKCHHQQIGLKCEKNCKEKQKNHFRVHKSIPCHTHKF